MNSPPGTRAKQYLTVIILILAAVATYHGVLGCEFLTNWDDADYVTNNPLIREFTGENLKSIFSRAFLGNYAPVQILSYLLDYSLWGLNPLGFHLGNLVLHICSGLLLYFLAIRTEMGRIAAFAATLIFLLHPVQVETVAWISQRKTLLAMAFFLAALHCHLSYASNRGASRWAWYLLSLVAFALSLLSKPVAVILPLVLLTYDFCFRGDRHERRKQLLEKVPFILLALAAGWLALMTQAPGAQGGRLALDSASHLQTLLTMPTVLSRYLLLIFRPTELNIVYSIPLATDVTPAVIAGSALLAGYMVIGWLLMRNATRLFFWYSLFFIGLLPVSQIVPLVTLMNDRYLYLPMAGMATFISLATASLCHKIFTGKKTLVIGLLFVSVTLGALSHERVKTWHDTLSLWKDATEKAPASATAWAGLGNALELAGNERTALEAYRRALDLNPADRASLANATLLYQKMGLAAESQRLAFRLVEYHPGSVAGWLTIGENFAKEGKKSDAEAAFRKVLAIDPNNSGAREWLQWLQLAQERSGKQ